MLKREKYTWSDEEIEFLKANYPAMSGPDLCKVFGKPIWIVRKMIRILGIKGIRRGQFTKGDPRIFVPKKGSHMSIHTQFKKGHAPANTKYDGAISRRYRIGSKTFIYYIRIEKQIWMPLHRHIWEKANGPIEKGYYIRFIDGNTMNCTLENLMKITMDQNARLNANYDITDKKALAALTYKNPAAKAALKDEHELIQMKKLQLELKRNLKNVV